MILLRAEVSMKVRERLYSDYFMRNRYDEYENFLKEILRKNFLFIKVSDFDKTKNNQKSVILRHDIDNDVHIAKKMFDIEKKLHIKSTYYFRWKTLDLSFINDLLLYGNEIGYHYEEIADFAKKNHIKTQEEILTRLTFIQDIFIQNMKKFEEVTKIKLTSISSHGDWINRKLNISNIELIDNNIKSKLGLKYEAYEIEPYLDFRLADRQYPEFWYPSSPYEISSKDYLGLILVHPRRWNSSFYTRLKEDFNRFYEEISY